MLSTFVTALLFAQSALSFYIPQNTGRYVADELVKRQSGTFSITGASVSGSLPVRLEVRDLQQNADQWNIYLLALARFQATSQDDRLSWYSVAGIHGYPLKPWDGVGPGAGAGQSGYCHHASILFPTWHRPFGALYDQILQILALQIAAEFSGADRDRYTAAAQILRGPYLDWAKKTASGESNWPQFLRDATITVNTPTGQSTIPNPLNSYSFHPLSTQDFPDRPYNSWSKTVRYPSGRNGVSQDDRVGSAVDSTSGALRSRLYNLFSSYTDYARFSNKAWIRSSSGGDFDSLESLHDQFHGLVGNGGHMSSIDYSSFDPVFWMHHNMIDRVFALWQVINPDSWITATQTQSGTYTIRAGSTLDSRSELTPFHKSDGSFYTSDDVRDLKVFGYTYQELLGNGGDLRAQVISTVNVLYGSSTNVRAPASATSTTSTTSATAAATRVVSTTSTSSTSTRAPSSAATAAATATSRASSAASSAPGRQTGTPAPSRNPTPAPTQSGMNTFFNWFGSLFNFRMHRRAEIPAAPLTANKGPAPESFKDYSLAMLVPRASLPGTIFVHAYVDSPQQQSDAPLFGLLREFLDSTNEPGYIGSHVFLSRNAATLSPVAGSDTQLSASSNPESADQALADARLTGTLPIPQELVSQVQQYGIRIALVSAATDEQYHLAQIPGFSGSVGSEVVTDDGRVDTFPTRGAWTLETSIKVTVE